MIKILFESLTTKYFQFSGRASRKEYWGMYLLQNFLCQLIFVLSSYYYYLLIKNIFLILILVFASAPPFITILVRRLHDFNFSGWWLLVIILFCICSNDFFNNPIEVFFITNIPFVVLGTIKGTLTTNKYGEPPTD